MCRSEERTLILVENCKSSQNFTLQTMVLSTEEGVLGKFTFYSLNRCTLTGQNTSFIFKWFTFLILNQEIAATCTAVTPGSLLMEVWSCSNSSWSLWGVLDGIVLMDNTKRQLFIRSFGEQKIDLPNRATEGNSK